MIEFLFQTGISNACFALALAFVAIFVGVFTRRPHLTYILWLLVFIKLVTPPVLNIPIPEFASSTGTIDVQNALPQETQPGDATLAVLLNDIRPIETQSSQFNWSAWQTGWFETKPWLFLFWTVGTGVVIAWSLLRVFQFNRLLHANSRPAPINVQAAMKRLARQLNLRSFPNISTTSSRISPLVWWVGGNVHVVIPQSILEDTNDDSWQWVLAHELAHVRRRDYLVRWLEWFACACFWWNPVVWWAQRNLRASEELCCDALVLSRLEPDRRSYADSILKTVESLVCPVIRPPAMASEINSGGYLEKRVVMIMSGKVLEKSSRFMQLCVLALALFVFPLGLVHGQDFEKVEKQLQKLVDKDHLSQEQASAMMGTLKRMEQRGSDRAIDRDDKSSDRGSSNVHVREAYGRAVAELETILEHGKISKEDMEKRLTGLRAAIAERMKQGEGQQRQLSREDFARAAAEMVKMVDEGKVKREDMEKRLSRMKEMLADRQKSNEESRRTVTSKEYAQAADAIKKLVAEGKVKKEEVEKRLAEKRKIIADPRVEGSGKTSDGADNARADRYMAIAEKLRAAVEAGEMPAADARKKLAALQAEMAKIDQGKNEQAKADQVTNLAGIARRLKLAVETGDMTKDEAKAKLKELTAKMKARGREKKADPNSDAKKNVAIDENSKKIRQAVADGQITKEEAAAKMKAIKEEAKQKKEAEAKKKSAG